MGEQAHDLLAARLMASGIPIVPAVRLAGYLEPDSSMIDENEDAIMDTFFLFEPLLKSLFLPKTVRKIEKESKVSFINSYDIDCLQLLSEMKKNKTLMSAKIYVDGSNLLYKSSEMKLNKYKEYGIDFTEIIFNKKERYLYSFWFYPLIVLNSININKEFLYEKARIFMCATGSRKKWAKTIEKKFGVSCHIISDPDCELKKKKGEDLEDLAMIEEIEDDLNSGSVDHFIICTGDGNMKNTKGFSETVNQLLKKGKKVTVCNFGSGSHADYTKRFIVNKNYNYINILSAWGTLFASKLDFDSHDI